ncbi:CHAD domain-containing protein [bacterium]|nr:CHAD domain-containing protein [bacterium]
MGKQVPTVICTYGARFMLAQVHSLEGEIQGVTYARDPECIHRMRVASRRLRNALDLFWDCLPGKKAKGWRDEIRKVTHALGNARDLDIQIAELTDLYQDWLDAKYKPGYNRLLLRLKQNRTKAQKKVNKTIYKLEESEALVKLSERLEKHLADADAVDLTAPELAKKAKDAIEDALDDFLSFTDIIDQPEKGDKLHAMRIAGKHLRYTMEMFAPIYAGELRPYVLVMKDIQDQLGAYHDNDVWENWLPKFVEKERARIEDYFGNAGPLKRLLPGLHNLMEDRKKAKAVAYAAFTLNWQTLADERVWDHLRELIHSKLEMASPKDEKSVLEEAEAEETIPVDVVESTDESEEEPEEETAEIELTTLPEPLPEEENPDL